jgi:hypothetical protein
MYQVTSKKLSGIFKLLTKRAGSGAGSVSQRYRYGSADSNPYQNVTDPEHWLNATWPTMPKKYKNFSDNSSVADPGCLYRIPDLNFSIPVSVKKSRIRIRIKEFKYFLPKKLFLRRVISEGVPVRESKPGLPYSRPTHYTI